YRFPPIHPIMSHQSLYYGASPYSFLAFRVSIELLNNRSYIARIVGKLSHCFRPVEQSLKFLVLWALSYHDGSGCCSLEIPITSLNLIAPYFRFIDFAGIDDKVSTPLGNIRQKRPVFL